MPDDYIPDSEPARVGWFNNFVSVATANATTLGLTTADLSALSGIVGTYTTSVTASANLKLSYHGANKTKALNDKARLPPPAPSSAAFSPTPPSRPP